MNITAISNYVTAQIDATYPEEEKAEAKAVLATAIAATRARIALARLMVSGDQLGNTVNDLIGGGTEPNAQLLGEDVGRYTERSAGIVEDIDTLNA